MQNLIPKTSTKETLYSYLALVLASLWMYAVIVYSDFEFPDIQNEFIRTNFFLLKEKLYELGWYYPIMNTKGLIGAYLPLIISTALVAVAFWLGIKSVKKVSQEDNKMARVFTIIPTTISGVLLFWIAVGIINSPL